MEAFFEILGVIFVLSCIPALALYLRARKRFSRNRLVVCPQNGELASITVDAPHAAVTALGGEAELRVKSCNRWEGHVGNCGGECVAGAEPAGLENAPAR